MVDDFCLTCRYTARHYYWISMIMPLQLPEPHFEDKVLSNQLLSHILSEIHRDQFISFARYMELALYMPQLGYYRNSLPKFGKEGDFVTAPELSSLFSYCVANQCAKILAEIPEGNILEFGAGSGAMAADLLIALQAVNQLPKKYYILELSANLRSQQRETIARKIPDCLDRVEWLTALPSEPMKGIMLANEVLDAMPVHLFTVNNGIKECVVTEKNGQLQLMISENQSLKADIEQYEIAFSNHYLSEINLSLKGWIKSIADCLSKGAVIIIDYGFLREEYYHPDRTMGTLMCHYRHHAHGDAFFYPGLQDITAHVDFTAVSEAAENNGLTVADYMNQATFLIRNNLLSYINQSTDDKTRFLQNQQVLKLTSPNEMGELFKVMILKKNE